MSAPIATVADMIRRNREAGSHWFDDDTIKFFDSTVVGPLVLDEAQRLTFFVTSEKRPGAPRAYSVRSISWDDPAKVETIGEFCGHKTAAAARRALNAQVK